MMDIVNMPLPDIEPEEESSEDWFDDLVARQVKDYQSMVDDLDAVMPNPLLRNYLKLHAERHLRKPKATAMEGEVLFERMLKLMAEDARIKAKRPSLGSSGSETIKTVIPD